MCGAEVRYVESHPLCRSELRTVGASGRLIIFSPFRLIIFKYLFNISAVQHIFSLFQWCFSTPGSLPLNVALPLRTALWTQLWFKCPRSDQVNRMNNIQHVLQTRRKNIRCQSVSKNAVIIDHIWIHCLMKAVNPRYFPNMPWTRSV